MKRLFKNGVVFVLIAVFTTIMFTGCMTENANYVPTSEELIERFIENEYDENTEEWEIIVIEDNEDWISFIACEGDEVVACQGFNRPYYMNQLFENGNS